MIDINDIRNCCGCSACSSICPKSAIQMKFDNKGFAHPTIDGSKCIDCGLCVKVCNFKSFLPNDHNPTVIIARHIKDEEVNSSRSGAFFIALCDYVLSHKGFVFGCELDENNTVVHKCYNTKNGINKFKGSKYVQSDIKNSFIECKDLLEKNKLVLFSGTACQIGGLISFLKQKKVNVDNLITCDLVCHGVPSPGVWKNYIKKTEEYNKKRVSSFDFRDKKRFGWAEHYETVFFDDSTSISERRWTSLFYSNLLFRESCYNCKYTTIYRDSDFTIADCWGIEKVSPELNDDKGTSLVLIHSKKANDIFEVIKCNLTWLETDIELVMQQHLKEPTKKPVNYEKFWSDYNRNSDKCIRKYFFPTLLDKLIKRIERIGIRQ